MRKIFYMLSGLYHGFFLVLLSPWMKVEHLFYQNLSQMSSFQQGIDVQIQLSKWLLSVICRMADVQCFNFH